MFRLPRSVLRWRRKTVRHFGPPKIVESLVAEKISQRIGRPLLLAIGYVKGYDFIDTETGQSFEVKLDTVCPSSGNMAIEIASRGKPSGLTTTTATTWLHVVPVSGTRLKVYEMPVDRLREAVTDCFELCGGDANASRMKLLPVAKAQTISRTWTVDYPTQAELAPSWTQQERHAGAAKGFAEAGRL